MKRKRWISMILSSVLAVSLSVSTLNAEEDQSLEEQESAVEEPNAQPSEELKEPQKEDPEQPEDQSEKEEMAADDEDGEAEAQSEDEPVQEEEAAEPVTDNQKEEKSLFILPEGFQADPNDARKRGEWRKSEALEAFETMTEGRDYAEGQLFFRSDSREYAELVSEIYHGELSSYSDRIAVTSITDETVTVRDVILAMAEDETLPFVEPNYYMEPVPELPETEGSMAEGIALSKANDWSDWIYEVFGDKADPFLTNPALRVGEGDNITELYQWHHTWLNTYLAWNAAMGDGINVGVIDNSVNENHEDLVGRVTLDDIFPEKQYGFYGHGTHMAGIIAANEANGIGGAGIAPHANIVGINIFEYPRADVSNFIRGLYRAIEHGKKEDGSYDNAKRIHILNLSIGHFNYVQAEADAIRDTLNAGITIVAAAGNSDTNLLEYPAGYDGVISVAASDMNGARIQVSSYGSQVTVAAPGMNIMAPVTTSVDYSDHTYRAWTGTSMATAVVSGYLALYMSKFGVITPEESITVLQKYAVKSPSEGMGAGVISFEKIFREEKALPQIEVFDKEGNKIETLKDPVPEGSKVYIFNDHPGKNDVILYTTDGSLPCVRNGEVVKGEIYDPAAGIDVDRFERNSSFTVRAVIVNSVRIASKPAALKVKTPVPQKAEVKIRTVALDQKKETLEVSDAEKGTAQLSVSSLIDARGEQHSLEEVAHQWYSSNPAIAEVDDAGLVTAKAPGSARISLKILDGSDKTAVCNVTVIALASGIEISGPAGIAPKSTVTYKAIITPDNAKNKKVTWSIRENVAGITVNEKNGRVTVKKEVPSGTEFTLVADAADGSGTTVEKRVKVTGKAKKVTLVSDDERAVKDKTGALKSAVIFSHDLPDAAHPQEDNVILVQAVIAENDIAPRWTSGNPGVATVDETGRVTAHASGTAKISAAADDGSGKKASFTLTVKTPVSSLSIEKNDNFKLSAGRSLDVSKALQYGKTYGTPSVMKADWSIESVVYKEKETSVDIKDEVLKNKAITINSSGKLSTSQKKLQPYYEKGPIHVTVKAQAKDGTEYAAEETVIVRKPFEYLFFVNPDDASSMEPVTSVQFKPDKAIDSIIFCDQALNLTAESSDNAICGAHAYFVSEEFVVNYHDPKTDQDVQGYGYLVNFRTYEKQGDCTITLHANDGSGKTVKLKVKVTDQKE